MSVPGRPPAPLDKGAATYTVHIGGLYRCCLESVDEQIAADPSLCEPPSGTRLTCKHCKKETLEYRGGGWRWSGVA